MVPTSPAPDPLVLIHGFTQTRACWGPVDRMLATDHDLVLLDAPGHGTCADVHLDLIAGSDALADAGRPGTWIGYSMGGRFALHIALARPDLVRRLVVISTTGGLDDEADRAARRRADEALADHLVDIGVPAFLDEWLALPLFAGLAAGSAHRAERLTNTAEGLASSLRLAGTGTQAPLWERLPELTIPVLVVAGARDAKFSALAERLATTIGDNAELAIVAGAGHTTHLEQPERFVSLLRAWLAG